TRPASASSRSCAHSEKRVAVHVEGTCVVSARRAAEGIALWSDFDVDEAGVLEHLLPSRTGEPAGDSAGPEVDVAQRLGWHGSTVGDVGELQTSVRAEHAADLREDCALVGAQVDHSIRGDDIGPAVVDGDRLG